MRLLELKNILQNDWGSRYPDSEFPTELLDPYKEGGSWLTGGYNTDTLGAFADENPNIFSDNQDERYGAFDNMFPSTVVQPQNTGDIMPRKQREPGWFNQAREGESAFGANVMDPGSNIESEEKIVKSADGTVTKTTVSNKQNTPAFQGMQTEQTQGGVEKETQKSYSPEQISAFDQSNMEPGGFGTSYSGGPTQADYLPPNEQGTLIDRIVANNANQPGDVYDGPMTDPWAQPEPTAPTAPLVPTDRRAMAAEQRALAQAGTPTDIQGVKAANLEAANQERAIREQEQDLVSQGIIPPSEFDISGFGRTANAPFEEQMAIKAEADKEEATAQIQAGVEAGLISPEQAEAALGEISPTADDLAFEQAEAEDAAAFAYGDDIALKGDASASNEAEFGDTEWDSGYGSGYYNPEFYGENFKGAITGKEGEQIVTDAAGESTDLKEALDAVNKSKNPEESEGILDGLMQWASDNPAMSQAVLSAVANYVATGNPYEAAGMGVKGYMAGTQNVAKNKAAIAKEQREEAKWQNREAIKQRDKLVLAGYKASIKTGKVPTARETSQANRAYAKSVSDEFSAMVPGEQKNLYRTAFNSSNVAKTMSAIKKRYGIDMLEATPEQDAAFKQAAVDLLEANARTIARGGKNPKLDTNMFKYYENNVIRSTAIDKGIPVGSFDTIDTGDINKEQMKKAYMKIQQARGLKDQSDTDLWKIAYSNYNALSDSDKSDLAKAGAKNNMSPFLYFVNVEATFVAK